MSILKQDVAYGKEQIRELEQKWNNQEAQLKGQHELIAKLQDKARYYKEVSQGTRTEFNTTKVAQSVEDSQMKILKLEKQLEVIQHSRESEMRKFHSMQAKYEKKWSKKCWLKKLRGESLIGSKIGSGTYLISFQNSRKPSVKTMKKNPKGSC